MALWKNFRLREQLKSARFCLARAATNGSQDWWGLGSVPPNEGMYATAAVRPHRDSLVKLRLGALLLERRRDQCPLSRTARTAFYDEVRSKAECRLLGTAPRYADGAKPLLIELPQ